MLNTRFVLKLLLSVCLLAFLVNFKALSQEHLKQSASQNTKEQWFILVSTGQTEESLANSLRYAVIMNLPVVIKGVSIESNYLLSQPEKESNSSRSEIKDRFIQELKLIGDKEISKNPNQEEVKFLLSQRFQLFQQYLLSLAKSYGIDSSRLSVSIQPKIFKQLVMQQAPVLVKIATYNPEQVSSQSPLSIQNHHPLLAYQQFGNISLEYAKQFETRGVSTLGEAFDVIEEDMLQKVQQIAKRNIKNFLNAKSRITATTNISEVNSAIVDKQNWEISFSKTKVDFNQWSRLSSDVFIRSLQISNTGFNDTYQPEISPQQLIPKNLKPGTDEDHIHVFKQGSLLNSRFSIPILLVNYQSQQSLNLLHLGKVNLWKLLMNQGVEKSLNPGLFERTHTLLTNLRIPAYAQFDIISRLSGLFKSELLIAPNEIAEVFPVVDLGLLVTDNNGDSWFLDIRVRNIEL